MTEVSSKRRAGEEGNEIWEELRGPRGGRSEARAALAQAQPYWYFLNEVSRV